MQLRRVDTAGGADSCDFFALAHFLAFFNQEPVVMGISGNPSAAVFNQDKVTKTFKLVTGIGNRSGIGGFNGSAECSLDIDAVIVSAFGNKKVHSQKEMFEKILKVCESTGKKRNFIYGYQTHPDNLMHITGTYSFAVKFSVLGINRALQKFCKKLYEKV